MFHFDLRDREGKLLINQVHWTARFQFLLLLFSGSSKGCSIVGVLIKINNLFVVWIYIRYLFDAFVIDGAIDYVIKFLLVFLLIDLTMFICLLLIYESP